MAAMTYEDWIGRGRSYQQQGRPIDAVLCYRQASRLEPKALDPHFLLGEILWQLGSFNDAIAAWREARGIAPRQPAPHYALAEALLATGDAGGARDTIARLRELTPETPRFVTIDATARMMLVDAAAPSAQAERLNAAMAIAAAVKEQPALLSVPTIAGPMALALDALPHGAERDEIIAPIVAVAHAAGDPATMPVLLLALVAEVMVARGDIPDLAAQAAGRSYVTAEHDALRRIAFAASGSRDYAREVAESYARLCAVTFASPMPLTWPRRTAGRRMRVVMLTLAAMEPAAVSAMSALVALPRDSFDLTQVVISLQRDADGDLAQDNHDIARLVLPATPDLNAIKAVAALDADVLIDLAGLAGVTGPLLAARPARAQWTVATLRACNAAPLVDRVEAEVMAICAALHAAHALNVAEEDAKHDPVSMAALWNDALRAHQQGDRERALAGYAAVLEQQPGFASAHYLQGNIHRDAGDIVSARAAFDAALAASPGFVDARVAAANAAIEMREPQPAVALCEQGLAHTPDKLALWRTLGLAHLARRDGRAAVSAFARALDFAPNNAETHYNLGVGLQQMGEASEAARAYQRALYLRPEFQDAEYNIAVLFQEQGAIDPAVAAYSNVLRGDPRCVRAYKNLGEMLWGAGRIEAWLVNFARFEANCPNALPMAVMALEVCQFLSDFPKLETYLDGLRKEKFFASNELELVDSLEQLLFLLLYFDVEGDLLAKFSKTYDASARHVYGLPMPRPEPRRPGRLRVGYVSGDLRNHVMGKMMWQAIQHHDKSRFELFFFSLSDREDDWTANYRGIADHYEVVAGLDENTVAQRIAAHDIDVLVDLATHTKGAKPGVFALKPARVQITHVASAGTLGLSAVDYKLTDRFADLPESQQPELEAFLAMDGCVYPYRHIAAAAEHPFHRAPLGMPGDAVIIGAFTNALKLSRRCLVSWRDVLNRIPAAVLAFSPLDPAQRTLYVRIAASVGIAPERIIFLPQGRSDAENQARYNLIDFVLDPMPYGGANGTLEALDMGVPVVTLVGKRHAERTGYSILMNLGVTQTIAQSGREYVDIAERLARDHAFMHEVRTTIRAGLSSSPLTDMRRYTRNLEAAYITALEQKCPAVIAAATGN